MPATFARPELLASPDSLAEHLSRPGIRVVDCRYRVDGTGRQVHAAGHIPGAVHLDWAHELIEARAPRSRRPRAPARAPGREPRQPSTPTPHPSIQPRLVEPALLRLRGRARPR